MLHRAAKGEPGLGYSRDEASAQLEQWGCGVRSSARTAVFKFQGEPIDLHECPSRMIPAHIAEALGFYQWWTSGSLPVRGGILDQSATMVDAMTIFGGEVNRLTEEDMEKARSNAS